MVRALLERLSRGVVLKRRLKTDHGPRTLYISPDSSLRYWLPGSLNSDSGLVRFAADWVRPGAKVWDIGANVGVFTFLAGAKAGSSGRVLSVDADPFHTQLLLRSCERLPASDAKAEVFTVCISDKIGTENFAVPIRSRASNFVIDTGGCSQAGGIRFTYKVLATTLDFLLEQSFPPEIVKLDIEGMEARALRASPVLLSKVRPVLQMEVWDEIADELTDILKSADYVLRDGDAPGTPVVSRATWSTIASPREKGGKST